MNNIEKRFSIIASSLAVLVLLNGCGEETNNEVSKVKADSVQAAAIEVTTNENAQEIKVAEKKVDKSQSKSYYYDYNIKSEYDQNAQPAK